MPAAEFPPQERERLEELRRLRILDTPADPSYDDLTLLAAELCQTPVALITLVDEDRQWFKSRIGFEPAETAREVSFCAHAILGPATMIVNDAAADPRFQDNALVRSDPHIRFYAGVPLSIRNGLNVGTLCVIDKKPRQLSERQIRALEALGRQVRRNMIQKQFRHIVETFVGQAPAFFGLKDERVRFEFVNGQWREMLRGRGDPEGKTSHEWAGDAAAAAWDDADRAVLESGLQTVSTEPAFGIAGKTWLVNRFCSQTISGRPGVGMIAIDVTGRVEIEQKLGDAERQLEHARRVESIGMLASTIAHEFNNVLMGIIPHAELIRREASEGSRVTRSISFIAHATERGRGLVQQILRYGRPVEPSLVQIDLSAWLRESLPSLRAMAGPSMDIVLDVPDCDVPVAADADQLHQVLTNLVANARDAMNATGRIIITLQRDGSDARLTVTDTGVGVPPAALDKIFEPLFTTKRLGSGIGLAVSRRIVEKHGGSITATSELGRGTTFEIRLPLVGMA